MTITLGAIEKRPGWDWMIVFRDPEDNGLIPCQVFGVMSALLAVQQAHADAGLPNECEILAIVRSDMMREVMDEIA